MHSLTFQGMTGDAKAAALVAFYDEKKKGLRDPRIRLTYSMPVTLHRSRRTRDDVTAATHEVSGLFPYSFAGFDRVCYRTPRLKRSGFYLPMDGLEAVEIVELAPVDYRDAWAAVAASLRENGINPGVASDIERVLAGRERETRDGKPDEYGRDEDGNLRMHWAQNWYRLIDKPKRASFKDVIDHWNRHRPETLQVKSIADFIAETKRHPSEYTPGGFHFSMCMDGSRRDRSVGMDISPSGEVKYYAASEYAGCGNGDYYIMTSFTGAIYAEHD